MKGDWHFPWWIAHRGAGLLAPENTLAAFRLGARHGYSAFECDVKLSADGVPFLLHDATLERTTSGHGTAGDLPWSELSRLDAGSWHSKRYAGEPLASLQAVAHFVQANGFWLDLEIKPTPGTEAHTGAAVAEAVARMWHGSEQKPLLSSFQPEALSAAHDAAPHLRRALLLDKLPADPLTRASELHCAAVITERGLMDATLVQRLHGAGLKALVYTVNDQALARSMQALGIDGLVTDAIADLGD